MHHFEFVVFIFVCCASSAHALHFRQNVSADVPNDDADCSTTRVFDIGLPRTGTESFCEYGATLGFAAGHQGYSHKITPSALQACKNNASMCAILFPPLDPEQPDMFCDHPAPGIGCQLAQAFPSAKFVLVTRNFENWFASARYWMCKWGTVQVCPGEHETDSSLSLTSHVDMYGAGYKRFCELIAEDKMRDPAETQSNREALCGVDNGKDEIQAWSNMGLVNLMKDMMGGHDDKMKLCVPADRLLVLDLEDPEKAKKLGHFLACSGRLPEYPHVRH